MHPTINVNQMKINKLLIPCTMGTFQTAIAGGVIQVSIFMYKHHTHKLRCIYRAIDFLLPVPLTHLEIHYLPITYLPNQLIILE